MPGYFEQCNEISVSIKGRNFLMSAMAISFSRMTLHSGVACSLSICNGGRVSWIVKRTGLVVSCSASYMMSLRFEARREIYIIFFRFLRTNAGVVGCTLTASTWDIPTFHFVISYIYALIFILEWELKYIMHCRRVVLHCTLRLPSSELHKPIIKMSPFKTSRFHI